MMKYPRRNIFSGTVDLVLSVFMTLSGLMLIALPLLFHDFLVMQQFRPAVRPYYPLFFGGMLAAGAVVLIFGILGFFGKLNQRLSKGRPFWDTVVALSGIAVGSVVLYAVISVYITTEYLSADGLYMLILTGLLLGLLLFFTTVPSGVISLLALLKKKPVTHTVKRAAASGLIFACMGAVIAAVVMLPPDVEAIPFPDRFVGHTVLYSAGDAGYQAFRIPTMITAPDGTVLAFAEARKTSREDWAQTDIVIRRSLDKGKTWTPLEVILHDEGFTLGNACPVVDETTGLIWLIFCKQNNKVLKTFSEDNGLHWAEPSEITNDVKKEHWTWYAAGPGQGIQLKDGTLVIAADHVEKRKMNAHIIFSNDHGATWQLGGTIPKSEEAAVAELDNGALYMNIRPVKPGCRVTAVSCDKGMMWQQIIYNTELPDPACQGSLLRIKTTGPSVFLFANAADPLHREKMTVRLSTDGCETWQKSAVLYPGLAGYSSLALIDPETRTVGCAFECGANHYAEQIVFVRFTVLSIIGA